MKIITNFELQKYSKLNDKSNNAFLIASATYQVLIINCIACQFRTALAFS